MRSQSLKMIKNSKLCRSTYNILKCLQKHLYFHQNQNHIKPEVNDNFKT